MVIPCYDVLFNRIIQNITVHHDCRFNIIQFKELGAFVCRIWSHREHIVKPRTSRSSELRCIYIREARHHWLNQGVCVCVCELVGKNQTEVQKLRMQLSNERVKRY